MATIYSVTVNMSDADVEALGAAGAYLCILKQVSTATSGVLPVIWLGTPHFGQQTEITWQDQFGVYDTQNFQSRADIVVTNSSPANLGTAWQVASANNGTLTANGQAPTATEIQIANATNATWNVGAQQSIDSPGTLNAICTCTLLAGFNVAFTPIEQVLLYFDTSNNQTGSILSAPNAGGLLVDLTASTSQSVTYSTANQWGANTGSQFTQVPASGVLAAVIVSS